MKRFLLTLLIIPACSAPFMAWSGEAEETTDATDNGLSELDGFRVEADTDQTRQADTGIQEEDIVEAGIPEASTGDATLHSDAPIEDGAESGTIADVVESGLTCGLIICAPSIDGWSLCCKTATTCGVLIGGYCV